MAAYTSPRNAVRRAVHLKHGVSVSCAYIYPSYASDTYEQDGQGAASTDTEMTSNQQPEASTSSSSTNSKEYPVIMRASNGKHPAHRVKISTLIQPHDSMSFSSQYISLARECFSKTLRKKDKKKKDARKAALKAAALKSGKKLNMKGGKAAIGVYLPKVSGARRGAGHAKRQRSEKARARAVKKHMKARQRKLADVQYLTHLGKKLAAEQNSV
jgi:hypothetical protein